MALNFIIIFQTVTELYNQRQMYILKKQQPMTR